MEDQAALILGVKMNNDYSDGYKDALNGGEMRAGASEYDKEYTDGFEDGMRYIQPFFTNHEPQLNY